MADKMLGKVVAGAALGSASLLVFNPTTTYAAGPPDAGEGKVITKPDAVKPGDHVKLLETCPQAQEHATVWSKVTGTVHLTPIHDEHGDSTDPDQAGQEKDPDQKGHDGKDRNGREEQGGAEQGTEEQSGADQSGADQSGADQSGADQSGADLGNDPDGYYGTPKPPEPEPPASADMADPADGGGGGVSDADQGPDGKMREGDQGKEDESKGPDRKDHDGKGHNGYGMGGEDGWEHMKDFVYYGDATVGANAQPGTYQLKGSCGEGRLVVLPRGPVNGGDGGMTRTSTDLGMAAGGVGILGAAALGGLVLMRRRRTDDLG